MALPVTTADRLFAIRYYQKNWWVNYRGQWIGYFPGTIWKGTFTAIGLAQWFGEVCAASTRPATWMGDGILGTKPGSALIDKYYTVDGSGDKIAAAPGFLQTDKSLYAVGTIAGGFRYGGPKSR